MTTASLTHLGWTEEFAGSFGPHADAGFIPARVAVEHRSLCGLYSAAGELTGELAGRLRHEGIGPGDLPGVGDWVAAEPDPASSHATIHAVLPRKSCFLRKRAGENAVEQVLASNVDFVFLVTSLAGELSPRRLERYLVMAWESGAAPVLLLNKADLATDIDDPAADVRSIAGGVPLHIVSATTGLGIDELGQYFRNHRTVALLGSSGVGKSTLINQLVGREIQRVQPIRAADGKGRHTTVRRELIVLPDGGLIMDTPGMREMQLWEGALGIREAFHDIDRLANGCKFDDCQHDTEPECAVHRAVESGTLAPERPASYHKLVKELRQLDRKRDKRLASEGKRRDKAAMRRIRWLRTNRDKP